MRMFTVLCAEGLHGAHEHITQRQVRLIEKAYLPLVNSFF